MITNDDDYIDSRDVIARIEELRSDLESDAENDTPAMSEEEQDEAREELRTLESLAKQGEFLPDWRYGEGLIRDGYFRQYAEELADDIGAIDRDARWPLNHIDWEAAANELKQDYTAVDFDGVTYWARS